jgi:hypothetical protein
MSLNARERRQKGLAFLRERSGTVVNPGRPGCSEILPRRLDRRSGASVVRRGAAINLTEDLNVKVGKEAITRKIRIIRSVDQAV